MSEQSIPLKRCTKCGNEFHATLEHFPSDKSKKSGLRSSCRICERKRSNEYKKTHPEVNRANAARFRKRHPERHREGVKQSRKRHWPKFLERCKKYQKQHPERGRVTTRNYRSRKRKAEGRVTAIEIEQQYKRQKGQCYYCHEKLSKKYHADHAVPLDRGGSNNADNIVVACPKCNRRKSNKLPHEWPEGGRLL